MGAHSLRQPEETPSFEPIKRATRNLRARHDGNPAKFAKAQHSLSRLERRMESAATLEQQRNAMEIYRKRMERVLSLSTTRLRIADGTDELFDRYDHDVRTAARRYGEQELALARSSMRSVTRDDLTELRDSLRRERIHAKRMQRDVAGYEASRLATESAEVADMTAADVAEARLAYARHRIAERAVLVAETDDAEADYDAQLAKAEAFVASLDERAIIRSLTPEPNGNATRVEHWWHFVDDDR